MLRGSAGTIVGIQRPWARLALGTPAAPWSPTDLGASLLGWWSADRSDLITLSGSQVITWTDIVGGYAPTQSVAGSRPVYSTTGWGGISPGITFDAVDDYLQLVGVPTAFPTGSSPSEIWALADQTAAAASSGQKTIFAYGNDSATARTLSRNSGGAANTVRAVSGNGTSGIATDAPGDFSGRHVARGVFSSTTVTASMDGTAGSGSASVPATVTTRLRIGAGSGGASNFWSGVAREILVTLPLSVEQAAALETYLDNRR